MACGGGCGAAGLGLGRRRGAPGYAAAASSSSCRLLLFLLLLWVGGVESPAGECVPARELQPRCHTDLATEVVCCWNAPAALPSANCTEAFQLRYRTNSDREFQVCLPRDRRGSGLCPLYTCAIPAQEFKNVQYHFALDRLTLQNWTEIWKLTEEGNDLNVKPLPLVNLTIAIESDLFRLHWEKDPRAKDINTAKMNYELAYWLKGQEEKLDRCPGNKGISSCPGSCRTLDTEPPCFAVKQELSEIPSGYEIYADQLTPHSDYVASVRYRLVDWGNTWSEWSSPSTWHNGLEPGDQRWKVIPWLCVPMVVVILLCYVCLGRVKEWQDSVPHPVVVMGKQISSPSFPENRKSSSPRGVKALLCHLCNRGSGKKSHGRTRPKASSGQRVESKVPRGDEVALRALVLRPEVPRIECSPIRCSQETGIGPEMPLEETSSPPEAPHADALMASLFRNAVRAGDTWLGPELSLAGQGAPCGPPWLPPDLPPQAPCLDPEGSPQREAVGGSPESGRLSCNLGSTASLWAASPAPHQGPIWGPSIPEEAPQGPLLWPHGPPGTPAGGFGLQRTGPGTGGPVGSLPLTASGYKSFDSLSQPMATFHQPWEEEEEEEPLVPLPGGQQIQLPLPGDGGGGSSSGDDTSLPLGPGLCGQQMPFPRGQDSCEDDLVTGPSPPAVTPGPKDPWPHTSPGYQSFSSLLPKDTEAQGPTTPSGPEPPYKPLFSVLRSGATEPPGGGTPFGLHLGGGRSTETSTWPGTLWGPHLDLSQDLGSLEEKGVFPGQRGLFSI